MLLRGYAIKFITLKETLVKRLRGCRVNMDTIKDHQEHVHLLPTSSDSAVVCALCCAIRDQTDLIAGMATTIDALFCQNVTLSCALQKANSYIAKQVHITLPENRRFTAENFTKSWSFFSNDGEGPPAAAKTTETHIMDFCRFYFIKACNSVVEIQRYACRLTGKHGKDATLGDLPEDIVNFMIDFVVDAIGLGDEDIELDVEHFLTQPSL
ncbi:unnamed protein product [Heligmosomoides polygyrus]|uniref:Vacuolar protein sorting-associated protein 28 homolog n=1 Tax=Heligmosomoides polygyrus TaxID=6339 RepID=A0A183GWX6_HELPZ|nr:unnamed protein product [Heligmosomoides polygyrus]